MLSSQEELVCLINGLAAVGLKIIVIISDAHRRKKFCGYCPALSAIIFRSLLNLQILAKVSLKRKVAAFGTAGKIDSRGGMPKTISVYSFGPRGGAGPVSTQPGRQQ